MVAVRVHRQSSFLVATIDVLVIDVKRTRVSDIMTHRHRCADMCYNGIKFIEVQFVLVFLLIAFVTETFQNEWRWAVAADLFHSP